MSLGKNSINRANLASEKPAQSEQKFYDACDVEPAVVKQEETEVDFISTDLILPTYDEQSITCKSTFVDVVASVKKYGVLIPLLLRKIKDGDQVKYRILSGHKRLFAAKQIGIKKVPALIISVDDRKAAAIYSEIEKYDSKSKSFDKAELESAMREVKRDLPNYLL